MLPDKKGHFGEFGGRFVPETLVYALDELEAEYKRRAVIRNSFSSSIIILRNMPAGLRLYILLKT